MHHLFTRTRLITLAISSFGLFVFSIVLAFVLLPIVINDQIDKNVRLERGTDQWHRFKEVAFNISFNVTLFAVKNPDDVVNKGAKPILIEQGPYVFDEIIKKQNMQYNNNNTVSFTRNTQLFFNQTRSQGVSIEDKITTINPVYVAVMQVLKDIPLGLAAAGMVDRCLKRMFNNNPFILKDYPVRNILLDGIKLCDFKPWSACAMVCGSFKVSNIIEEVNDGKDHYMKFSYFNYKQIIPDGIYEVNTGEQEISKVGDIESWNYSNMLNMWNDQKQNNTCNKIRGNDGTMFPPHLDQFEKFDIFSTDVCRTVPIFYNGTDTYKDIEGNVYRAKTTIFHSSAANPTDDCYCPTKKKTFDVNGQPTCFLDGVVDIYPCLGLPVLMSQPHFLNADKKYSENLEGMNPDPVKHDTFVLLDKYTGIPLRGHKRVQLNLILRPVNKFHSSDNIRRTIFPLCWIDEGLDLPDDGIEMLNSLLYNTINLVNILKWVLIGVSFLLTVFACVLLGLHLYSR